LNIYEIIELCMKILSKYCLCDYCLGRQFASIGAGIPNDEKGRILKTILYMHAHSIFKIGYIEEALKLMKCLAATGFQPAVQFLEMQKYEIPQKELCYICRGILNRDKLRELSVKILKDLEEYEFNNFLVGARVPTDVREREDSIRSEYMLTTGEDIKEDVTRVIGRFLVKETGKKVEYSTPDIVVIVDLNTDSYELIVNPVFIKGRYRKLVRDLPQTPWICRNCWGRGCQKCNFTGREYPESISELIGNISVEVFEALSYKFHGAGREDVDAIVLGTGRPFVLELKHPRKRNVDLKKLEEKINLEAAGKIEVSGLEYSSRRELRILKSSSPIASKTYEAIVEFERDVKEEDLASIREKFRDIIIDQWTPTRVLKRRSDKLRKKKLYYVEVERLSEKIVKFKIKAQGGLYVKELIDGDNGRTKPNIAEAINNKPLKIQLAVIEVENVKESSG